MSRAPREGDDLATRGGEEAKTTTGAPLSITAIVLTYDEEIHVARCIERLRPLVERIVVVDSFSTDRTVEIARQMGAEVVQRAWKNPADQLNWALETIGVDTDWVLRLDCDEYLEPGLQTALRQRLGSLPSAVAGVEFKLKVIFRGRFIRFGGYYRTWLPRLWRRGAARIEQRWMDERAVLTEGRAIRLSGGDLVDASLKDIDWWTTKHNRYATLHMVDFVCREFDLAPIDRGVETGALGQGWFKRVLRDRIYARAPLYLRAVLYFLQRYILRLGFLDGRRGFVWHFLQGFWLFVLIDAKIDEARAMIRSEGPQAFQVWLRTRHGVEL